MRIVAGTLRGRPVVAPKGQLTRPTADRTRQALFNVLENAGWSAGLEGRRVLDLFAGSGALGLEALSRGAAYCLFVDTDTAARDAIAANIERLGLAGRAGIEGRDASRLGPKPAHETAFDLAFLDPPYGRGLAEQAMAALTQGHWLAPGALAVVERGKLEEGFSAPTYAVLDERIWGAARVAFLAAKAPPSSGP